MNISQAKRLCLEQGIETDTIDWGSCPKDINPVDYVKNEYGLILKSEQDAVNEVMASIEESQVKNYNNPEKTDWKEINKSVKSIAIVGNTGTGKTAMVYNILDKSDKIVYWHKHPSLELLKERGYKPLHRLADLERLGDCVVVIDEPQLYMATYDKRSNVVLMRVLSLCRQRNITLIISTSDTRFVTRGIESYMDIWIIKDLYFDLVKQGSIIKKIVKDFSYIDFEGKKLNVEEYIFFSRIYEDYNGQQVFEQPAYFDERHSKPYSITANETAQKSAKETK